MLKNILTSLVTAYFLIKFQAWLHSDYLVTFLENNLVSLLIALLAINTASLSIILSKIREILDKTNKTDAFNKTRYHMKQSLAEQIVLVFLSLLFLMAKNSAWINKSYPSLISVLEILTTACFIYAIMILHDTAKSVFLILEFPDLLRKNQKPPTP